MNFEVLQQVSNLIQVLIGLTNYPQTSCLSQACRSWFYFANWISPGSVRRRGATASPPEGSESSSERGPGRSCSRSAPSLWRRRGRARAMPAEHARGGRGAGWWRRPRPQGTGRWRGRALRAPPAARRRAAKPGVGRPGWPQQPLHERLGASQQRPGGGAGRARPRLRPGGRRKRRRRWWWRWWRCRWCPAPCVFPSGVVLLDSHVLLPGGFLQGIPQDDGEYGHPELAHLYFAGVLDRVDDCKYVLRWVQRPGEADMARPRANSPSGPSRQATKTGGGVCTAPSFVSGAENSPHSRW